MIFPWTRWPCRTSLFFLRLQTCSKRLLGYGSVTRECPSGFGQSASSTPSPRPPLDTHNRWVHPSFESIAVFDACGNLDEALQVLRNARTTHMFDVYRAVSPCGSRCSFSLSWFHVLSQINVLCGAVDAGALSQWMASVVNGWIGHFVHTHLFEFR